MSGWTFVTFVDGHRRFIGKVFDDMPYIWRTRRITDADLGWSDKLIVSESIIDTWRRVEYAVPIGPSHIVYELESTETRSP